MAAPLVDLAAATQEAGADQPRVREGADHDHSDAPAAPAAAAPPAMPQAPARATQGVSFRDPPDDRGEGPQRFEPRTKSVIGVHAGDGVGKEGTVEPVLRARGGAAAAAARGARASLTLELWPDRAGPGRGGRGDASQSEGEHESASQAAHAAFRGQWMLASPSAVASDGSVAGSDHKWFTSHGFDGSRFVTRGSGARKGRAPSWALREPHSALHPTLAALAHHGVPTRPWSIAFVLSAGVAMNGLSLALSGTSASWSQDPLTHLAAAAALFLPVTIVTSAILMRTPRSLLTRTGRSGLALQLSTRPVARRAISVVVCCLCALLYGLVALWTYGLVTIREPDDGTPLWQVVATRVTSIVLIMALPPASTVIMCCFVEDCITVETLGRTIADQWRRIVAYTVVVPAVGEATSSSAAAVRGAPTADVDGVGADTGARSAAGANAGGDFRGGDEPRRPPVVDLVGGEQIHAAANEASDVGAEGTVSVSLPQISSGAGAAAASQVRPRVVDRTEHRGATLLHMGMVGSRRAAAAAAMPYAGPPQVLVHTRRCLAPSAESVSVDRSLSPTVRPSGGQAGAALRISLESPQRWGGHDAGLPMADMLMDVQTLSRAARNVTECFRPTIGPIFVNIVAAHVLYVLGQLETRNSAHKVDDPGMAMVLFTVLICSWGVFLTLLVSYLATANSSHHHLTQAITSVDTSAHPIAGLLGAAAIGGGVRAAPTGSDGAAEPLVSTAFVAPVSQLELIQRVTLASHVAARKPQMCVQVLGIVFQGSAGRSVALCMCASILVLLLAH